jgi:outer membrane lipoprotein SlyB
MSSGADGANQSPIIWLRRCKMANKIPFIKTMIAISLTSIAFSTPVSARDSYSGQYSDYYERQYYDDYRQSVNYDDRRFDDRRDKRRFRGEKCSSGTTGTIIGGVVGGLLGREIGRGGRFNRPSTTGAIIGAGAGALAGRALEKSGNRC